jgi:hypothetical protein
MQKFPNIGVFENVLGGYLKELFNVSKVKNPQSTHVVEDPDQKCIRELLAED